MRLTVWGDGATQAKAVAVAIRDEANRHGGIESYNSTPDDDDTGNSGISFDVRLVAIRV